MLGKLLKYEWRNTYKVGLILLASVAMATLVGFLSLQTPLWQDMVSDRGYFGSVAFDMLDIMSFFAIMFYIMLLVGVVYATYIYLIVRFYRTMYTDEGYLLHTLPVSKHQILISKILVSSVWVYLVDLAVFVSVAFFIISVINIFTPNNIWLELPEFFSNFMGMVSELEYELGLDMFGWVLSAIAISILGIPSSIIIFFGAISVGQLFSKHRVLMAILSYVVIMIISSIINMIFQVINALTSLTPLYQTGSGFSIYMLGNLNAQFVTNLLLAVGCYIASYYITSRKLNMD